MFDVLIIVGVSAVVSTVLTYFLMQGHWTKSAEKVVDVLDALKAIEGYERKELKNDFSEIDVSNTKKKPL